MTVIRDLELDTRLMRSFTKSANQARQHCKFGLKPGTATPGIQQREKRIYLKDMAQTKTKNFLGWEMKHQFKTVSQEPRSPYTCSQRQWGPGAGVVNPSPVMGLKGSHTRTDEPVFLMCTTAEQATPKLNSVKQQPFYSAHGFYALGIQKGQRRDSSSLLHSIWGLSWASSFDREWLERLVAGAARNPFLRWLPDSPVWSLSWDDRRTGSAGTVNLPRK